MRKKMVLLLAGSMLLLLPALLAVRSVASAQSGPPHPNQAALKDPTIAALSTLITSKQIPAATADLVSATFQAGIAQHPIPANYPTANPATQTAVAKPIPTCASTPPAAPTVAVATVNRQNPADVAQHTQAAKVATAIGASPNDLLLANRTTDLAPQVSASDKNAVYVRHPDCTIESFLMPNEQIDTFKQHLPPGDIVLSISPPPSSFGHHPLPITPLPGRTVLVSTPTSLPTNASPRTGVSPTPSS